MLACSTPRSLRIHVRPPSSLAWMPSPCVPAKRRPVAGPSRARKASRQPPSTRRSQTTPFTVPIRISSHRSRASNTLGPPIDINTRMATSRSEEHTSELQSPCNLVCRLLLETNKNIHYGLSLRKKKRKKKQKKKKKTTQ